ncbi:MAG TPA: chorismate synthase [Gemmatimonadota bacterium]
MKGNSFGRLFRIVTWGESHGPAIGVVIDGCPAGLPLDAADVQRELDRRRPGQSELASPRAETDRASLLSGVFEGRTLGTPISILIPNADADPSTYESLRDRPRPGHADWTYAAKHGHRDWRGGGRASARETAARVAAGAVAKRLLALAGVEVLAHVNRIGRVRAGPVDRDALRERVERTPVRCADLEAAEAMRAAVLEARDAGDSVGGSVEGFAFGVPAGLGEPVYDKLEAELARAMLSINASTAFEIGTGIGVVEMRGSELNDPFGIGADGRPAPLSNRAGGIQGGISTGQPLRFEVAFRPPSSIPKPQRTVDLATGEEVTIEVRGRHDPVIPPRAVPVVEAMTALVLADAMLLAGRIHPDRVDARTEGGDAVSAAAAGDAPRGAGAGPG